MSGEFGGYAGELRSTADDLPRRASQVVRKVALDTEADAKAFAPVDTGFLRNSIITTVTDGGLRAVVEATANYSPFVEYGTSRMAPRPFVGPAKERNEPGFVQAIGQIV